MDYRCYGPSIVYKALHDAEFHPDLNDPDSSTDYPKRFFMLILIVTRLLWKPTTQRMTGLTGYLKERGIDTVYVVGIATDFCVAWISF